MRWHLSWDLGTQKELHLSGSEGASLAYIKPPIVLIIRSLSCLKKITLSFLPVNACKVVIPRVLSWVPPISVIDMNKSHELLNCCLLVSKRTLAILELLSSKTFCFLSFASMYHTGWGTWNFCGGLALKKVIIMVTLFWNFDCYYVYFIYNYIRNQFDNDLK